MIARTKASSYWSLLDRTMWDAMRQIDDVTEVRRPVPAPVMGDATGAGHGLQTMPTRVVMGR